MTDIKTFKLIANAEFEAYDLEDALEKLEKHFKVVREGTDSNLISKGSIEVQMSFITRKD